jgi:hypothetical protein
VFAYADTNLVLDFHGDPVKAGLVVFSDGNHHMALEESLRAFLARYPDAVDAFYATTPPRVLVEAVTKGQLHVGNLTLSRAPHVFIGPSPVLKGLVERGLMTDHAPFMQSRGNVLLVRHGNPKGIAGLGDLLRDDVRLALSNPKTETASYDLYRDTLRRLASEAGVDVDALDKVLSSDRVVHSAAIHHREIPQLVADGRADAAVIYYHLALRYTRVFAGRFEIVKLAPLLGEPGFTPANRVTVYHIGRIGDGGAWGATLIDFMNGDEVAAIYRHHGLQRPT